MKPLQELGRFCSPQYVTVRLRVSSWHWMDLRFFIETSLVATVDLSDCYNVPGVSDAVTMEV